jgi:hypothetical protein
MTRPCFFIIALAVAVAHGAPLTGDVDVKYWEAKAVEAEEYANSKDAYFNDGETLLSCTGKLRVCRNGEASKVEDTQVCVENKLGRAEVTFDAQNWPGAMYNGWLMQIILMEHMQIPFRFNDELNDDALGADFFHWLSGKSRNEWYGPANNWQGMENAQADPTCQTANAKAYGGCAHLMSEIWSPENGILDDFVHNKKLLQHLGTTGITGKVGWFVSKHHADLFGGFTYSELNDVTITRHFGKPQTFIEYCKQQKASAEAANNAVPPQPAAKAAYDKSMCAFLVDQAAGFTEAKKCGASYVYTCEPAGCSMRDPFRHPSCDAAELACKAVTGEALFSKTACEAVTTGDRWGRSGCEYSNHDLSKYFLMTVPRACMEAMKANGYNNAISSAATAGSDVPVEEIPTAAPTCTGTPTACASVTTLDDNGVACKAIAGCTYTYNPNAKCAAPADSTIAETAACAAITGTALDTSSACHNVPAGSMGSCLYSGINYEPMYPGKQDKVWCDTVQNGRGDVAHVAEAPCGWTTYYPVQMQTVRADAIQYTYSEMADHFSAMAWNTRHLLKVGKGVGWQAMWKASPYFYPIIGWWWKPDTMFEKHRYDLDPKDSRLDSHWEMKAVNLEPSTDVCQVERREHFVKHYKSNANFCARNGKYNGKFNLTYYDPNKAGTSWMTQCGLGPDGKTPLATNPCVTAKCDHPTENFKMVGTNVLSTMSPDTVKMLRRLSGQLTAADQEGWISAVDLGGKDAKSVVCEWARNNFNKNTKWVDWLPDSFVNTGCRKYSSDLLCSGHGKCEANKDPQFAGNCICDDGYVGNLCENTTTSNTTTQREEQTKLSAGSQAYLPSRFLIVATLTAARLTRSF